MHKFVHQKVSAAMYYLRSIARCHRYFTLDATKALVHAYVTSRLDYCNSLLLGLAKKSINKLQRIQNVAARAVMGDFKEVDSKSLLHHLHWLPIWKRIIHKNILLLFKAMNGNSPEYLKDLLPPLRINSKQTQSSCAHQFLETRTCSEYGDRCFHNSVPKLWNKLCSASRAFIRLGDIYILCNNNVIIIIIIITCPDMTLAVERGIK